MTKADLVERVADAVGSRVTKEDSGLVVDAFLDAVKDAFERGEGIEIRGFGTYKVRRRKAATREPGRRSKFHPVACRSSSRRASGLAR